MPEHRPAQPLPDLSLDDERLLRYSRQIMLPQIDAEGQERLLASHALVLGLGGLGSPVAMYLAAAGVGHLTLVDYDSVELSNLQRQVVHRNADLGRPKVESARDTLMALNPDVQVETIAARLEGESLAAQIASADVVIDASDNFATRYALNDACVAAGKPLVSGAAIRMEGQVAVFRPDRGGPCYRCLYRDEGGIEETCSENGILAPVVGVIGSLQAVEVIKVLLDIGEPLDGRLLLFDALAMEWRTLKLKKDPECPICSKHPS